MVTGSLHSTSICPPHSPTRITKNSTLKSSGAFHCPNTSRIRFWAFSYSMGEPCGRSNQLITYFIVSSILEGLAGHTCRGPIYHQPAVIANSGSARRRVTLAHRSIVGDRRGFNDRLGTYRPAVRV